MTPLPPPAPRGLDTTLVLAIAGIIVALLIVIAILAIFAPAQAFLLASLITTVMVGTVFPALLSLGKAAEARAAAAAAQIVAARVEDKTDALQIAVDGRLTALIASIQAQGTLAMTGAALQATLDEKAAQAGREAEVAGHSDTQRTIQPLTTYVRPADPGPPAVPPGDYPDGPTPWGPPSSPGGYGPAGPDRL